MSGYQDFSAFYDRLMADVDYAAYADYLLSLFALHSGKTPEIVLDLACGSGSLSLELAARGVDVIGVDGSQDMLVQAREKAENAGHSLLFLEQDMRELDLYGTVNGAVCVLDSISHLCCTADVRCVFQRLSLFVEPGGLLIFDVNTPYKHRNVLGDNAFVFEQDDFFCVWRNRLLSRTCEVDMQLDFFVRTKEHYTRYTDFVRERAYTQATLSRLLREGDFEPVAVYAAMTADTPPDDCERWVFVARNVTKNYETTGGTHE